MIIGLMSAMKEEAQLILKHITEKKSIRIGNNIYYSGLFYNQKIILVFSRWGKVAAASCATTLILKFKVSKIIFTGVAGALNPNLKIGDIVIGNQLIQHDLNAEPLLPKHKIPLLNKTYIKADFIKELNTSVLHFLETDFDSLNLTINTPNIYTGTIATGDQFIASNIQKKAITDNIPDVLCAEMEGAAVGQVCDAFKIPFGILRIISDNANEDASIDFPKFVNEIASPFSLHILKNSIIHRLFI